MNRERTYAREVSSYPENFQQLLADGGITGIVVVSMGSIVDHYDELEEDIEYWKQCDYDKAGRYLEAMRRGDTFPPLVASEPMGRLIDGYHRAYAYRALGILEVEFIYVDENQPTKNPRLLT